jgi:hypothetical protein
MNSLPWRQLIWVLIFFSTHCSSIVQASVKNDSSEYVTIAILAKDKAHTLPLYLECLEQQTWPASKTYLYIRTNNNNDKTVHILRDWIARVGMRYAKLYFDDTDVTESVEQFKQHEWNYTRFKVLGKIRQDSVTWAFNNNSHYFVVDCDNFILPDTIESLVNTHQSIVAPLLRCSENCFGSEYQNSSYSNYHLAIDANGYYADSSFYYNVLNQEIKGLIEVPVVHCAYLIRNEVLNKICYDDASGRFEYVIFSDSARKQNIPQYIDNRKIYGYITFAETQEEFAKEVLLHEYLS